MNMNKQATNSGMIEYITLTDKAPRVFTQTGKIGATFSELFADTLNVHGMQWTYQYYVREKGMLISEFMVWVHSVTGTVLKTH